ncbi:beta-alanyl-dopamine/carcinine hydrolase [Eupeodes corollae]|uniref:beta-alanyl-dopamine/carcinine hydrolase n=1 Tax=Eupeodes corollae TaxID=290404 RepID=UPI0024934DC6|nr:beta-alanyl-dopamine/carcinine hydrolase [Eupeodes corollae]XP_055909852.1 beta-alanyl-dopamine/carcinine hydrolase [Eupeodes corollae]
MIAKNIPRRQAIPILYTRGTHYDVGFDMGRTFAAIIKSFLQLSQPLNEVYLPLYATDEGRNAYNETLECVKQSFPQYIRELQGVSDGAQVEFHKLFLLHMDDITPQSIKHLNDIPDIKDIKEPTGCSTIMLNTEDCKVLAHTEDALTETLNHYYFVVAHIINDTPQGKYNVQEERFMSLCYAGHLPGYTMNYNHHGLVFSINTLSAEFLRSGKTPRHFITRALLSADNFDMAHTILKDCGVGAGDGCSINMTFLNVEPQPFYNIEMAPAVGDKNESQLDVREVGPGDHSYHANSYLRIKTPEANQIMIDSSVSRMNTFSTYDPPKTKEDIVHMLGDCSGGEHCVFRENGDLSQMVKTIAVGVFDLKAKTYALYSDNPRTSLPHVTIPLFLKE